MKIRGSLTWNRNKSIHKYFLVNYTALLKKVAEKVPKLYEAIKEIIKELNKIQQELVKIIA